MHTPIRSILGIGTLMISSLGADAQLQGYMDNPRLASAISEIASSSDRAAIETIGQSLGGTPIRLITLSSSREDAGDRPALLITAGIDGRSLVSTETAIRIARRLLADHPETLDEMTIYIIPRVNPDGASKNLEPLTMEYMGNGRVIDEDRDRAADEDGPDDLNGDGVITMMRRINPPIEDPATHLADPDDPRLGLKPDAKENQIASFSLYVEGLDNDGDGLINEDGFGAVDLDENFMHRWPEHEIHSGSYPLSEPESRALARFVLAHDNIVLALTLGMHDNLVNPPDSRSKDTSGQAPLAIDAKDADMYAKASELYQETTGQKNAPKADAAGSFEAWLYAQRGIPSFASVVWGLPEEAKAEESHVADESTDAPKDDADDPSDEPALTPSAIGDISQESLDELAAAYEAQTGEKVDPSMMSSITPEMVEGFAAQMGIEIRRIEKTDSEDEGDAKKDKKPKKKAKGEDAKWLAYFDEHGIDAFVDWTPFDHPTLGKVEIGGFKPLVKINPPADQLDDLARKQTDFVLKLIEQRPRVSIIGPQVSMLADGLYEIRFAIENDGPMPTSTVYSQTSYTVRPIVVRISSDVEHLVSGQRVGTVWGIDGHGGRSEHHWIIRTDDISSESIEIIDPRFGSRTIRLGDES